MKTPLRKRQRIFVPEREGQRWLAAIALHGADGTNISCCLVLVHRRVLKTSPFFVLDAISRAVHVVDSRLNAGVLPPSDDANYVKPRN